jgi:hypothetical protein
MGTENLMNRSPIVFGTILLMLAGGGVANAQEKGQTGLTLGYPASVGVIFHLTDRVALRPEFSVSKSTTSDELSSPIGSTSTGSWALGVGVSGLFYIKKWDNLRAYLSPRFTYTRSQTTLDTNVLAGVRTVANTLNSYGAIGSFGAQYSLSRRFGAFGEVGFGYTRQTSRGISGSTTQTNAVGTRSGAGFIFYF